MKFSATFAAASLAAIAAAAPAPTKTINKRADQCAQYAEIATGAYTVYNDLWGESDATSGSGCVGVDSLSGSTIAWHATWTWTGGTSVKAFPNAVVSITPTPLSKVTSMKSTWKWSYSGSITAADVAYDMFTSSSASGSNEYEIMVWLAAIGSAGPISYTYGSDGSATPIATVTIAGVSWKLYYGSNGSNYVYSFLPASGSEVTSFSGDVYGFFTYLINDQSLPSSQYLISVGAGSEPTTGSGADFKVSAYSMVVNY